MHIPIAAAAVATATVTSSSGDKSMNELSIAAADAGIARDKSSNGLESVSLSQIMSTIISSAASINKDGSSDVADNNNAHNLLSVLHYLHQFEEEESNAYNCIRLLQTMGQEEQEPTRNGTVHLSLQFHPLMLAVLRHSVDMATLLLANLIHFVDACFSKFWGGKLPPAGRRAIDLWGQEFLDHTLHTLMTKGFRQVDATRSAADKREAASKIVRLLVEGGARLNENAECGMTPLVHAVQSGNVYHAQILLELGADADQVLPDGSRALHHALTASVSAGVQQQCEGGSGKGGSSEVGSSEVGSSEVSSSEGGGGEGGGDKGGDCLNVLLLQAGASVAPVQKKCFKASKNLLEFAIDHSCEAKLDVLLAKRIWTPKALSSAALHLSEVANTYGDTAYFGMLDALVGHGGLDLGGVVNAEDGTFEYATTVALPWQQVSEGTVALLGKQAKLALKESHVPLIYAIMLHGVRRFKRSFESILSAMRDEGIYHSRMAAAGHKHVIKAVNELLTRGNTQHPDVKVLACEWNNSDGERRLAAARSQQAPLAAPPARSTACSHRSHFAAPALPSDSFCPAP